MKYMSISEYARFKEVSRQAIQDRIDRGTLGTVLRNFKRKMIPVSDTELAGVKAKALAPDK